MGFSKKLFSNTKKPEGVLGKMMVNTMNSGHAGVSDWGMSNLKDISPKNIIDLGCGGGRNAFKLMERYSDAHLTAVDYSEVSVEKTKKVNAAKIADGSCKVISGDVSHLILNNESFDLATAFETIYFWPGPTESFKEVYRVLKDGGKFMIVNESDGLNEKDEKWTEIIDGMTIYSKDDICRMLKEVGFKDIKVYHKEKSFWICFIAEK